jgi:hypothetical protein
LIDHERKLGAGWELDLIGFLLGLQMGEGKVWDEFHTMFSFVRRVFRESSQEMTV